MTGRAEQRGERAAGCSSREPPGAAAKGADPWQIAVAGLQANCLQFGANLARLQQQAASGLARLQQQARAPAPAARRRSAGGLPVASLSSAAAAPTSEPSSWSGGSAGAASSSTASREEVGRATWTFLHTLAAQYPEHPTRQQKRDARNLIDILTRMYPCGECAAHFKELVGSHPPQVATRADFSLWMCEAHNIVNRRLGKPTFNCSLVQSRWAGLECGEDGADACSLDFGRRR
ncbi:FAD-linked sulfhydryl oxidase ERV1 [Micractinium conductrix]|uniref:Sulfhydryl oxidase n=1 Tax=Micractinium conductrix TaxID=554055 RepID=A0A2P6VN24_9CHLO|nr:FAD-linked sulfhydryl oxidase ERV1 [Micractinium conductrix]|eukprot:PSC75506.1 FAD-linked sulfhydryl oxidase ERV1 [Micractinium conductrix]